MNGICFDIVARRLATAALLCSVPALLSACACPTAKGPGAGRPAAARDAEIADVLRLPQELAPYADAAGERLAIGDSCRATLLDEFRSRFFAPWTRTVPLFDLGAEKTLMANVAHAAWYGENRRLVAPKFLRELLDNCALETFPARNEAAIAVAPSHLRGLPTRIPLFNSQNGYPFDMLQYPNVKLNEPVRILHASRDGIWFYVETPYSCGWMESRDLARAEPGFVTARMKLPQLVIIRDYSPINDGKGGTSYGAKIGTILPLVAANEDGWEVEVAVAAEGRKAVSNRALLPRGVAAPHPLAFDQANLALIGNQLLGQPYGWGEMYGLRDCSAMLRDFFIPFGIWLPRTATDQIASTPQRLNLSGFTPREKEEAIVSQGLPFLSLFFKPGHIMLYIGTDPEGRPLVFHNAWSIRVKDGAGAGVRYIGRGVVTTLEPGKELGLVKGGTLLEQGTDLATITDRCAAEPSPAKLSEKKF